MNKNWLITGAAGFIGSNLCAELLARGHSVVGLDNFFTGKRANIERLQALADARFRFVEADIQDAGAVRAAAQGCGAVVHLAAQVSVQRSMDNPAETNAINVDGFLNVLLAARDGGARRFVYASSCAVYGDNPALPLGEGEAPRPTSPYAAGKLINEHYATTLAPRLDGMATFGFRFFNIFGPWQDPAGGYAAVIPKWVSLCLEGRRPVMFGDGGATRDFCFVGNICTMMADVGDPALPARPGIYNLGTGTRISLAELFTVIRRVLAAKGVAIPFDEPERMPWREGDIVHSTGDISLARTMLGYAPAVDLKDGIECMLAAEYGLGNSPLVR